MKQQSRWVSWNKNKSNVPIPWICTLYKTYQKITSLTYKIRGTGSIPLAYISIKGTCISKHVFLCDVWSNKVDECHGITNNKFNLNVINYSLVFKCTYKCCHLRYIPVCQIRIATSFTMKHFGHIQNLRCIPVFNWSIGHNKKWENCHIKNLKIELKRGKIDEQTNIWIFDWIK
jgi:hypothetical protein